MSVGPPAVGSAGAAGAPTTLGGWIPFLCATGLGSGCLRPAPGTWGSLAAAVLALPVALFVPSVWWTPVVLAAAGLAVMVGLAVCPWAIRHYRRGDPSQVVIDEWAGLWLALGLLPGHLVTAAPYVTVAAVFCAFRVFDVAKPWPVRTLERMPGGWGIMADDCAAGAFAALAAALVLI